ncbi:MAG: hypothetical protein KJ674_02805 [Nanoarchaeota archaeon]|nr:hypothetical protein [Nanoarchaeota archaeon]
MNLFEEKIDYDSMSFLLVETAVDIDNFRLERSEDLQSVYRLTNILWTYQLAEDEKFYPSPHGGGFPYEPLMNALVKSNPQITFTSQLASEMVSLRSKLEDITGLSEESLTELGRFLCTFSREIMAEMNSYPVRRRLAA